MMSGFLARKLFPVVAINSDYEVFKTQYLCTPKVAEPETESASVVFQRRLEEEMRRKESDEKLRFIRQGQRLLDEAKAGKAVFVEWEW